MPAFETLAQVFEWVAVGGGAAVLTAFALSWLLENASWWHTLPSWVKSIVPVALSGLIGALAQAALAVDLPGLISQHAPLLEALILALINYVSGQAAYMRVKDSTYAEKARNPALSG